MRLVAQMRSARASRRGTSCRACEISAICTFSMTVIEWKVAAIWKVRPTPSRQISRGFLPTIFSPSSSTSPGIRPQLPVEHVEAGRFAGAVRAEQREQLAALQIERDVVDRAHAAEAACQIADLQQAAGHARFVQSRFEPVLDRAGDPLGKTSTRTMMTSAEKRAPIFRLPRDAVLQGEESDAADDRPDQRARCRRAAP